MSDERLECCPFCGGEVEFHPQEHHMENFWNKNTIHCPTCGFLMEETSRLQLFKKWNTRKPMGQIIERLEELEQDYDGETNSGFIGMCIDVVKGRGD